MFRKSYRKNQAMEENKEVLKEKFARGKELGQLVNESRVTINNLKNQVTFTQPCRSKNFAKRKRC
jgi:hypothetical protein